MDFIKKILELFANVDGDFPHLLADGEDGNPKEVVITIHTNPDGKMVFNIFDNEEWAMVKDICELTEKDAAEVVADLNLDDNTRTITIDPKEFD